MAFGATLLLILQTICQILLLAVPVYYLLLFLRKTRGYRVLFGIIALLFVMEVAARQLHMNEIGWILDHLATFIPITLIILFQPELRRLFAELGGRSSSAYQEVTKEDAENVIKQLSDTILWLSSQRIGALIAIEQKDDLDAVVMGSRALRAPVNSELLNTIFFPGTSLHDGGVVIRGATIATAGGVFPIGATEERRRSFGTRHRAAIGLSEKTDAVVLVVSEETGLISVAYHGELIRGLGKESLGRILLCCFGKTAQATAEAPSANAASMLTQVLREIKEQG